MRFLLAIMILFATIISTFTAEAADCCQPHDCSAVQAMDDVDGDCHGDSDPANADCPECLHHCYGSPSVLGIKATNLSIQDGGELFAATDNVLSGREPSGLLRPPQSV